MSLFEKIDVDENALRALVWKQWGEKCTLTKKLKHSQNITFLGSMPADAPNDRRGGSSGGDDETDGSASEKKVIVRYTKACHHLEQEVRLLSYLSSHGLEVCPPIATQISGNLCVPLPSTAPLSPESGEVDDGNGGRHVSNGAGGMVAMFTFAPGKELPYTEWKWMKDRRVVFATGSFLGRLHRLTALLPQPESLPPWHALHKGTLAGIDEGLEKQTSRWVPLHGDVNPSNWFWNEEDGSIHVFDWDQACLGPPEMDLAQTLVGPTRLRESGIPVSGAPCPEANPELYTDWLLEGYKYGSGGGNGEGGEGTVIVIDRDVLRRCVNVRREFYFRFCERAIEEGSIPPDMEPFVTWCAKEAKKFRQRKS